MGQFRGPGLNVLERIHQDMHNPPFSFHAAAGQDESAVDGRLAVSLEDARADDEVHSSGFIFEGHEYDPLGRAGTLAENSAQP